MGAEGKKNLSGKAFLQKHVVGRRKTEEEEEMWVRGPLAAGKGTGDPWVNPRQGRAGSWMTHAKVNPSGFQTKVGKNK